MWWTKVGDVEVLRVEEMLTAGFEPGFLFPHYDPEVLEQHPQLAHPNFFDAASGKLMSSMHSWMLRVGKHVLVRVNGVTTADQDWEPLPDEGLLAFATIQETNAPPRPKVLSAAQYQTVETLAEAIIPADARSADADVRLNDWCGPR